MSVPKSIAIIGATEQDGAGIARQFASTRYRLLLVSDDVDKLKRLLKDILRKNPDAEMIAEECLKDGCWEADSIIMAIPFCEHKTIALKMKEVATQKPVIIFSNGELKDDELQNILPDSKIIHVSIVEQPNILSIRGNDEEVLDEVAEMFNRAGYHTTIHENKF